MNNTLIDNSRQLSADPAFAITAAQQILEEIDGETHDLFLHDGVLVTPNLSNTKKPITVNPAFVAYTLNGFFEFSDEEGGRKVDFPLHVAEVIIALAPFFTCFPALNDRPDAAAMQRLALRGNERGW